MKKTATLVLVILWLSGAAALTAQKVVEEIVAIVNDDVITLSQYRAQHEMMVQAVRAQFQGPELDKQLEAVKKVLLDQMINDLLLLQMAKEKQLDSREALKAYLENIKKQNNIESDEDLKQAVTREGVNYDVFLKQSEENLLRQQVIYAEVDRHIVLDDAETMAYYKEHLDIFTEPVEYKLRAIVLPFEEGGEAGLEAKKKEIGDKLAAGGDFSALAGEHNQPPLNESKGDLGMIKKTDLEATLEQAAAKLKVGEAAPWLRAKSGWYLLKLEERKDSQLKNYDEVKKDIELRLSQVKRNKALDEFLKGVKAKSYIKILRPDPLVS